MSLTTPDVFVDVQIVDGTFVPDTVQAPLGAVVRWRNSDSDTHTIVGPYWQSSPQAPGRTFALRVNNPGAVAYRCSLHPGETGVLDVR